MGEKDKQDKQDRERLLKRFKDRKPLDDNADSDIMAPPDVREAMSSRRYETANIIEQGIYDLIEVSELHSGALKLADKIIALDKPTGVEELQKENHELRELLWLNHHCAKPALYGDDGEMQCSRMDSHYPIDFLRDTPEIISEKLRNGREKHPTKTGVERVEKCTRDHTETGGNYPCNLCTDSGEIVTELTPDECVKVLKTIISNMDFSECHHCEGSPDGSRLQVAKEK